MTVNDLYRLIKKYGPQRTLSDVLSAEAHESIRRRLGMPLEATDAEVNEAIERMRTQFMQHTEQHT